MHVGRSNDESGQHEEQVDEQPTLSQPGIASQKRAGLKRKMMQDDDERGDAAQRFEVAVMRPTG